MHNTADLTGQRFFRLVAIRFDGYNDHGQRSWLCRCDCGGEIRTLVQRLRSGATKSCGCWCREVAAANAYLRSFKHGNSSRSERSPEYISWAAMHARCRYPSVRGYELYGGRGIRVCERWSDFELFLADMGTRPSHEYSIDRIDPDGNYEPSNCRWASPVEQRHNQRGRN